MTRQSQSGGSNFGPRLKVPNGLSKGMLRVGKDYQKYQANMKYTNLCNCKCNASDQRENVVKLAKKNPLEDSNGGPSNALVARYSKSEYSLSSKHSRGPSNLRLENSLNPSPMDFKCFKPSRVRNMLPPKKMEVAAPTDSKNDPNATSRCLDHSHHMKPKDRLSRNMESSRPPTLGLRSTGQSNPYRGDGINAGKDGTRISKLEKMGEVSRKSNIPALGRLWVASKDISNKEKGKQGEVMTKEKEMISHAIEGCDTSNNHHKQTNAMKTNEAPSSSSLLVGKKDVQGLGSNLGDNSTNLYRKNHSGCQRNNASFMEGSNSARVSSGHVHPYEFIETNLKLPSRVQVVGGNGKTNNGKFRRSKQPLLEEKLDTHGGIDSDGVIQHQTCRSRKRRRLIEDSEDEENNGGDQRTMVVEHDEGVHQENLTSTMTMKQGRCIETNKDDDGGYQNPVGVENHREGVGQLEIYKSKKKRRRYIETDKYEDDMCDEHQVHVKDGTNKLTQLATSLDDMCVEWQCCCSKPIDKPTWRGIFKIDGKECISLVGHLSTKSCEKVRKLSQLSSQMVVQVTKVPRLAVWPKIWLSSKPTGDNIGLYFFPHEMRHDEELDQLVKEIMDKDLVLRAVIDEAEMLIFPSVLLPERHQTFRTKHYLWAAFKAKEGKGTASVEQEDKEKHVSSQLDEVQSEESDQEMILMKCAKPLENLQLPAKSVQEVETCCVQGPTNMHLGHEAVCTSASTAGATDATTVANAATVPSGEATSFATNTASFPANHGAIDPSMEARPSSSGVFSIFVRETPKVQKLIKEFERDGELIAVMEGDAIGVGQWASNITTAMQ